MPKDLIVTDPAYADLDEIFDFIAADMSTPRDVSYSKSSIIFTA